MANLLTKVILISIVISILETTCSAENEQPSHNKPDITEQTNAEKLDKISAEILSKERTNSQDRVDITLDEAGDSPISIEEVEMVSYEETEEEEPNTNQNIRDYLTPPAEGATSYAEFGKITYSE